MSTIYLNNIGDISTVRNRFTRRRQILEIKWNANVMQLGNFIDVFLARHVSGTQAHHQEH